MSTSEINFTNLLCLNLGAGKVDTERYNTYLATVHVDRNFLNHSSINTVADELNNKLEQKRSGAGTDKFTVRPQWFVKSDIFEFVDNFPVKFDTVLAERIFEHLDYTNGEIGRLLEALNMLTFENGKLEIVVPNAILLSKMLLDYENSMGDGHIAELKAKLIINTEFCNFKGDPHASVWTPKLAHEYIESEGTWKIDDIVKQISFGGRDIYMKIFCSKVRNNTSMEKVS